MDKKHGQVVQKYLNINKILMSYGLSIHISNGNLAIARPSKYIVNDLDSIEEVKQWVNGFIYAMELKGWISVKDKLPEIGQIVDIWEMPNTETLKRNLSFKGTKFGLEHHHTTDYEGWRSTNYIFSKEKDDEGEINCFQKVNERYFTKMEGGPSYKKLCVENGEVMFWKPVESIPKK